MALKLATVVYARARGFRTITTYVDERNEPMLARNRALGFVRGNGAALLERPGTPR